MSERRLTDVLHDRKIQITPEPLEGHEGQEFTLRGFTFADGSFSRYATLDTVDTDGEVHYLTTGGETIMRILNQLDPETDLPVQVKFVKVTSGNGRKVWSIE